MDESTINTRRKSLAPTNLRSLSTADLLKSQRRKSLENEAAGAKSVDIYKRKTTTDYVIQCPSPKIAKEVVANLEARVTGFDEIISQANQAVVCVRVPNTDTAIFEDSLKTEGNPVLMLTHRLQELKDEAKTLTKQNWFKRCWYGLPTKIEKINTLEHLLDRIAKDDRRTPAQHCQALRRQYPVVTMGLFRHKTWDVFNQIENEARKPALAAQQAQRLKSRALKRL